MPPHPRPLHPLILGSSPELPSRPAGLFPGCPVPQAQHLHGCLRLDHVLLSDYKMGMYPLKKLGKPRSDPRWSPCFSPFPLPSDHIPAVAPGPGAPASLCLILPLSVLRVLPLRPCCFSATLPGPGLLRAFALPVASAWNSSQIHSGLKPSTPFSVKPP